MYVAIMKHNSSAEGSVAARLSYEDAVSAVHTFFLSYDFELRDGRPYDEDNADGRAGGFDCFQNVEMHGGKVARFTHCDGDGPVAWIQKSI